MTISLEQAQTVVAAALAHGTEQGFNPLTVAVLDPGVELHSSRGLRKGVEAARIWATRAPGGVQQTIELEELYEDGTEGGGGRAVALSKRH